MNKIPRVPFRVTTEARISDFCSRIQAKFEVISAFKESDGQCRSLMKYFQFYDTANEGKLNYDQFFDAMTKLNFVGIKRDVENFFNYFDHATSGCIDYRELSELIYGLHLPLPPLKPEAKQTAEKLLNGMIQKYGSAAIHLLSTYVRSLLRSGANARHTVPVDRVDFEMCLQDFVGLEACEITSQALQRLIDAFDPLHTGTFDGASLISTLTKHALPFDRKLMIKDIFLRFEASPSGQVSVMNMANQADFSCHPAVRSSTVTVMQAEDQFYSSLNSPAKTASLTEFFEYYRGISVAVEDDVEFELMLRNTWYAISSNVTKPTLRRVLVTHNDGKQEIVELVDDLGMGRYDVNSAKERCRSRGVGNISSVAL